MKEITLYDAYNILQQCSAVVIDGKLVEPSLLGYEESSENEFMCLTWGEDYENEDFIIEVAFTEGDNETVCVDGCKMYLTSTEGEEEELLLLKEFYAEKDV